MPRRCTDVGPQLRACAQHVAFLAATCVALLGCSQITRTPRLVLGASELDLGQALPGETLTVCIAVKNQGGQVLHIHGIEAGCGCAAAVLARDAIQPGEEATLEVTVPIHEEGERREFIVILHSDDPAGDAVLVVRATAAPPLLRASPQEVELGEIPKGVGAAKRVLIRKPDGGAWPPSEPIHAESEHGIVQVTLVATGKDGAGTAVEVRAPADLPLGPFADTLVIKPAGAVRHLRLPVRGQVVPLLAASPKTLYFGDVDPQKGPLQRFVNVRRTDGKAVAPMVRSTLPAGMAVDEVEPESITERRSLRRLRVSLDPAHVQEEVKDGKLLLWLEGEPEPLAIGVMIFLARSDRNGQR
jgi:hypothetical protein